MPASAIPFGTDGLDRVGERRSDTAWLAQRWSDPRTRVLHVTGGRAETAGEPPALVLVEPYATDAERVLLGLDPDTDVAYFAVLGERPGAPTVEHDTWRTLRDLGGGLSARDAALLVHALGLANWHEAHPHCARCGARTVVDDAGHVRRCPVDGSQHHPRTDPAVIMLVTDEDDRALLGRHARWPERRFSTLAGFVEPGESAEAAVAREVFEEARVVVTGTEFVASQPWPFPSSLMLGFRASARGEDPRPDGVELAEALWFTREQLERDVAAGAVLLPPGQSIARRLIESWFGGPLGEVRPRDAS